MSLVVGIQFLCVFASLLLVVSITERGMLKSPAVIRDAYFPLYLLIFALCILKFY